MVVATEITAWVDINDSRSKQVLVAYFIGLSRISGTPVMLIPDLWSISGTTVSGYPVNIQYPAPFHVSDILIRR